MFKRIAIAAVAVLGISVSAQAADQPVKGPVYKASPAVFNWTGFYGGIHGGYAWGNVDYIVTAAENGFVDNAGGFGGLQIGYNRQYAPN
ncbi:MAG: hypothetical protein K2P86_07270 [Xanthobacteraceae bacterium]|nr:hypothetical protein [Xanthobacteraceae bacterium]